jgi:sterol desaturase/sphingolipid hydroxylase (fatty acid hydroxylase superfamily)
MESRLIAELLDFLRVAPLAEAIRAGDYASLLTTKGLLSVALAGIPVLLLVEAALLISQGSFRFRTYRVTFLTYLADRIIGSFFTFSIVVLLLEVLPQLALLKLPLTFLVFIYSYLIWELAHYVFHFSAHKVRILWCLHSTHHAPEHMHLGVAYTNFFFQGVYADLVRTSICVLCGVPTEYLLLIMLLDTAWSSLIHANPAILPKRGLPSIVTAPFLLPVHHRVHHARNSVYIDKNYCNLLSIWDRLFRTYQEPLPFVPLDYGLARKVNAESFVDTYFGEFHLLLQDIRRESHFKYRILYLLKPPGWRPPAQHSSTRQPK